MASVAAPPPLVGTVIPAVHAQGAFELALAFRAINKDFGNGLKEALENAAEPIRSQATSLARSEISGMARGKVPWYQMRIGSNLGKGLVYIAPQQRGLKRFDARKARPNLAVRLLEQELQALNDNAGRVEHEFENTMDDAIRAWAAI